MNSEQPTTTAAQRAKSVMGLNSPNLAPIKVSPLKRAIEYCQIMRDLWSMRRAGWFFSNGEFDRIARRSLYARHTMRHHIPGVSLSFVRMRPNKVRFSDYDATYRQIPSWIELEDQSISSLETLVRFALSVSPIMTRLIVGSVDTDRIGYRALKHRNITTVR